MSVTLVHEAVDEIERALRRDFPAVKRVISHAEPMRETTIDRHRN
jgi:divalent metal cation (Fe/Co/Zn/Cd) transporter